MREASCTMLPFHDALPAEVRAAWEALIPDGAPVFLWPDWLDLAIRTRVVSPGFVLLFHDGGDLLGLMPFQYRTCWSAEISAPLASDFMPALIVPGAEETVWHALAAWLHRSSLWYLRVGRFTAERFEHLRGLSRAEGLAVVSRQVEHAVFMDLPGTWNAYLAGLSKASRYKVRHAEEKILADFPDAEVVFASEPAECAPAINELIRLNCLRFAKSRRRSTMESPRMADLIRRFNAWAEERGYGCAVSLRIGGRVIAVATGIHVPGQPLAFYHTVGRDPTALPSHYSPGLLVAGHILRWAMAHGATRISLGQGSMPYKLVLGGEESVQWNLCLAPTKFAARVMRRVDPAIRLTGQHLDRFFDQVRGLHRLERV